MLLREDGNALDRPLVKRERGPLGTRCCESQADGVPCPGPDCDCDLCARAYAPPLRHAADASPPGDRATNGHKPHA